MTKKKLVDLTNEEFNKLKELGLLWEFYPDAPSTYQEIKTVTNTCLICNKKYICSENAETWNRIFCSEKCVIEHDVKIEKFEEFNMFTKKLDIDAQECINYNFWDIV